MAAEEERQHDERGRTDHSEELKAVNRAGIASAVALERKWPPQLVIEPRGDLCDLRGYDAIVNSANEMMHSGGGMDGMIRAAAGEGLAAECAALPAKAYVGDMPVKLYTGEALVTEAHSLSTKTGVRYIVHTVAPYLDEAGQPQPSLLKACYRACMAAARRHGIRSIAFPSLATGFYGYPAAPAAALALNTLADELESLPASECEGWRVGIVPYSAESEALYRKLMGR